MTTVTIECFGFLKEKVTRKTWNLPLETPCSVSQFKDTFTKALAHELSLTPNETKSMLSHCAIASEEQGMLIDDEIIKISGVISILPPVSGG